MSDHQQITDVLLRYATGIDNRDWALFRTCFAADCSIDYRGIGQWQGVDAVTGFMQRVHSGPSLHRLSNMTITVDDDRATARSYVDAVVLGPGGWGGANVLGYYDDELVRTTDGWRISARTHTGVRTTFLGPMRVIPSALAARLSTVATRRLVWS